VILAEDEASLYLQATLKVVWAVRGETPIVRQPPGRDHMHFYGALNLHTGAETVLSSPKMNAEVTALFLQKLLDAYPDRPILLLWDRAPWHRGPCIQALLAAHPRLELLYFPTAAPDLNPQEHVWKQARDDISHNHTETQLPPLAQRFQHYLESHAFPCSLLEHHNYHNLCMMFK
jgi:transposase